MEFFNDLSVPVKFLIAFVVVLAVLGVGRYLRRRFSGGMGARGQQPRLALIDTASVDGSRRLVLVRRDNVEHLLLIGGPTDIVVEPNIDRTGAVATAPAPVRETEAIPTLEPAPRQPPSLDGAGWPPGERAYVEPPPAMTGEAILRPQSAPVVRQRVESLIEDAPPAAIGGPTDVVVEPNIDRTGAAATAPAPVRETKASASLEPPPREPPSLEGSGWLGPPRRLPASRRKWRACSGVRRESRDAAADQRPRRRWRSRPRAAMTEVTGPQPAACNSATRYRTPGGASALGARWLA
jgi:hypothetical protein